MAYYKHTADVFCSFEFPLDMLRYDRCYPYDPADAARIGATLQREHDRDLPIKVATIREGKQEPWTKERWRSFSCVIKHRDTRKW